MKKLIMGTMLVAAVAGCQTQYANDGGDALRRPEIVRDIAYEKFTIGNECVSATASQTFLFGCFNMTGSVSSHYADNAYKGWFDKAVVNAARNDAYAALCEAKHCDWLVGVHYDVEYTNYILWDVAKVTVTGYPATLTGVELHKANLDGCKCK